MNGLGALSSIWLHFLLLSFLQQLESLFMFLSLLTVFLWRRGHWWLGGLTAVLFGLTRSMTICLLVFSVYEYLRQHDFQCRTLRFAVLSGIGSGGGVIF